MVQIPKPEDYGLNTETGFLPDKEPLRRLSGAYYSPWERLMDNFHDLILTERLREAVVKVLP
jgi:hypothetical protein